MSTKPANQPRSSAPSYLLYGLALSAAIYYSASIFLSETGGYTLCSSTGVYTVDESKPRVECLSVSERGIISAVGSLEDATSHSPLSVFGLPLFSLPYLPPKRRDIRWVPNGSVILPGLTDAHAHIIQAGFTMDLPLVGATSVSDVVKLIRNYILSDGDLFMDKSRWIVGMGWDQTKWPGKKFPSAADLDSDPILKGRPIVLYRIDFHASWVSPTVLTQITPLPSSVPGGQILRDSETGNPTGILLDNAMSLVPIPETSDERREVYLKRALDKAISFGLTSIHDADVSLADFEFFKNKAKLGKLPLRIYGMPHNDSAEYWGGDFERFESEDGKFKVRGIKLYGDGALGSWGAALLAPYEDKEGEVGIMKLEKEELRHLIWKFWKDGWQVNTHCIGDRANKVVLDVYEELIEKEGVDVREWRPRIEHAQIFAPEDLKRIAKLGVIASVQPTHATSDMWYAETRLGPERIKGAYAYQTLLQASPMNVLPLGSDFPVEEINPLFGFYAAVTRLSPEGKSPHGPSGWYPNEALTREQALKGMTLDAAYAAFSENELGSLSVGKKADFVVLDRDIMTVPKEQILKTKVRATVVEGQVVYGNIDYRKHSGGKRT
ncbi:amidohydrolase family-domain-containing protein [Flagelloscypha sp. PMI_526]|nr:amidohydrolase family-domain-containing protein [Flagelloscypha sp. PMI_526]